METNKNYKIVETNGDAALIAKAVKLWSAYAGETITVEVNGIHIYGFGSELGILRIMG